MTPNIMLSKRNKVTFAKPSKPLSKVAKALITGGNDRKKTTVIQNETMRPLNVFIISHKSSGNEK